MIIGVTIPSMIVVIGSLLTLGYIKNTEERQEFAEIADDLKDDVLEVKRREKTFLHFKDTEHLDEVRNYLSVISKSLNNIAPAVVKEIGEKDIHDLRTSLNIYAQLVDNLYNNFNKEKEISEKVRAEGRKLETFVSEGIHAQELSTSFVLHLRLLEKNYMLFRDKKSMDELTESLKLFHNIMPICFECDPYAQLIKLLIKTYEKSSSLTEEIQHTGDWLERITIKIQTQERGRIKSFLSKTRHRMSLVLILLCIIGPLFIYKTSAYVVAPIKRLAAITRKIADGDTTLRAPIREHDETFELSQSFNTMLDKLLLTHSSLERSMELLKEKQAQLVEAEKRASLGLLVSGVAHELNNPLNNISLIAERMVEDRDELSVQEMRDMNNILSQCERAKAIVENLLDFARARKSTVMEKLDIVEIVKESFSLVGNQLRINDIELKTDIPDASLFIEGNRSKLEQIIVGIMINAVQAIKSNGLIEVKINSDRDTGNVLIHIRDTGPGIPKSDIRHIFEPFFTTKPVGKGTGLGLSVAYSLAKEHGGDIKVSSEAGKGSIFTIVLPSYGQVT
jgi:signal transduction histidine kinase